MMEETKYPPSAPMVEAAIQQVDCSIGCVSAQRAPAELQVAILHNPKVEAGPMDAVLFDDWPEVLQFVQALVEAATTVWGLPPGARVVTSDDQPHTAH